MSSRFRIQVFSTILFGVVLIVFISFLLIMNYRSQIGLQKNALEKLMQDTKDRAMAANYFFSERKNDLINLSKSRIVAVYSENHALSMSMEYGLRASLVGIYELFNSLIDGKLIGEENIYTRAAFIDQTGKLLVDTNSVKMSLASDKDWTRYLSIQNKDAIIIAEGNKLIVSIPYFFKQKYAGQIIAWVALQSIYNNLIKAAYAQNQFIGFATGKGNFYLPEEMPNDLLSYSLYELRKVKSGEIYQFKTIFNSKENVVMVAARAQINGTPLSVINVLPASDLFGSTSPRIILFALVGLSVSILAGMVFIWRMNTKNLILHTRFEEEMKSKGIIIEKNKELKDEITRRQKAEKELKNYSINLEEIVEERTSELKDALNNLQNTQSQLLQSEKMASIGQLAAGVAHEINNPVGFVKSNLGTMDDYRKDLMRVLEMYQILEEKINNGNDPDNNSAVHGVLANIPELKDEIDLDFILEDFQQVIEESLEGTERVVKIVSDLKDFAHLDKAELGEVDINRGIESTLNIASNDVKYKAEVIKDFGNIPLVKCYPQRINQVFMNLLVNAAQAIENKGEIRIATRFNNKDVEIKISDTGCGIPADILPKIFDPFFTTKDVGKGTGLGLNMAYNIIEKQKGTIDVESEVGKGTTFTIRLPVG